MGKNASASTSECFHTLCQLSALPKQTWSCFTLGYFISASPKLGLMYDMLFSVWVIFGKLGKSHLMKAKEQHNSERLPPSTQFAQMWNSAQLPKEPFFLLFCNINSWFLRDVCVKILPVISVLSMCSCESLPFWDYKFLGNTCLCTL